MKPILSACLIALIVAVVPAEAQKNKTKSFTGCVAAHEGKYELVTRGKKGKSHQYELAGSHDFSKDVGHQVRVSGVAEARTLNVSSVQTVAATCK